MPAPSKGSKNKTSSANGEEGGNSSAQPQPFSILQFTEEPIHSCPALLRENLRFTGDSPTSQTHGRELRAWNHQTGQQSKRETRYRLRSTNPQSTPPSTSRRANASTVRPPSLTSQTPLLNSGRDSQDHVFAPPQRPTADPGFEAYARDTNLCLPQLPLDDLFAGLGDSFLHPRDSSYGYANPIRTYQLPWPGYWQPGHQDTQYATELESNDLEDESNYDSLAKNEPQMKGKGKGKGKSRINAAFLAAKKRN